MPLHKPRCPSFEAMWVDFNYRSHSVCVRCDDGGDGDSLALENKVTVFSGDVTTATLTTSMHGHTLHILLENPACSYFSVLPLNLSQVSIINSVHFCIVIIVFPFIF